jgi:hypothetical protein
LTVNRASLRWFFAQSWYAIVMATKAQAFKARQMRGAHPPKPKRPPRPRRDLVVDTSLPGVSATDRKAGGGATAARNRSKRSGKKGGAALENSQTGKPSRKSTRGSSGRAKRTSNLRRRAIRKAASPKTRARQAKAKGKAKLRK